MSRFLVVGMIVALTSCSAGPPATTAQGRCEQQVDQDPAVRELLTQAAVRNSEPRWQEALAQARRKSMSDCLNAAGIPQRGGVQPVSRAKYGFGWF